MTSDRVLIKGLVIPTRIGVHAWERELMQELVIDLALAFDLSTAANSDDVRDCLDYSAVSEWIAAELKPANFQLIESVAQHVASGLLQDFDLERVSVTVKKPGAVANADYVGVKITRTRA